MPKHIIIADNHTDVCRQIETEIKKVYPFINVTIADNGQDVILKHENEPAEVIIMDIGMPLMDGVQATQIIKSKFRNVKIILTSTQQEPTFLLSMMIHGANGFVEKNCNHQGYYEAIECVLSGDPYFPDEIKEVYKAKHTRKSNLPTNNATIPKIIFSENEVKILSLIRQGIQTKEIATKINLAPSTVATYRQSIYDKIGTHNVAEVIAFAIENGY